MLCGNEMGVLTVMIQGHAQTARTQRGHPDLILYLGHLNWRSSPSVTTLMTGDEDQADVLVRMSREAKVLAQVEAIPTR